MEVHKRGLCRIQDCICSLNRDMIKDSIRGLLVWSQCSLWPQARLLRSERHREIASVYAKGEHGFLRRENRYWQYPDIGILRMNTLISDNKDRI